MYHHIVITRRRSGILEDCLSFDRLCGFRETSRKEISLVHIFASFYMWLLGIFASLLCDCLVSIIFLPVCDCLVRIQGSKIWHGRCQGRYQRIKLCWVGLIYLLCSLIQIYFLMWTNIFDSLIQIYFQGRDTRGSNYAELGYVYMEQWWPQRWM